MGRLNTVWGHPRRRVIYPIGAADLAKLLGASLRAPGEVLALVLQTHRMASALDAASALAIARLITLYEARIEAALDGSGALMAALTQDHVARGALVGGASVMAGLQQTHLLAAAPSATGALAGDITEDSAVSDPAFRAAVVSYTGTGASQAITGVGFAPQVVIILRNGQTTVKCAVFDSITGVAMAWTPSGWGFPDNDAVSAWANSLTAFGADGFTVGAASAKGGINVNANAASYVALCLAAGTGAQIANFDLVSFSTDNTTDRLVSHNAGTMPVWLWNKRHGNLKSAEWLVDAGLGVDSNSLGSPLALTAQTVSDVSSSEVEMGSATRWNGGSGLSTLYVFGGADVAGAFKTGTYTGTGAAGNAITGLGFAPSVVLVRSVTGSGVSLLAGALSGGTAYDLGSGSRNGPFGLDTDGFTVGGTGNINQSGVSYRYLAWI
jgi:hypothetical protein